MSLFIGLDLGGTNLKYALGDEKGEVIARFSKPSLANQKQEIILQNMFSAIHDLLQEAEKKNESISAMGVGSPGCIDFKLGKLLGRAPNFEDWKDVQIKKHFEDKFKIPTWVDNDANLMALAEARKGAGRDYKNLLCATLGTGIGGGIILNNKIYRGAHYSAAEIGHIIIEYGGKPCNCGNRGCLEAYTAAPAMVVRYRKKLKKAGVMFDMPELSTEFIFEKAMLNEDLAKQTIIETCDYLGVGLASVANVIDPDIIILGGGVAEAGAEFINRIEQMVKQYTLHSIAKHLKVVKANLNLDSGIIGAILLASENFKKK